MCGLSNECVTDHPTNQTTDTASYRRALSHLKSGQESLKQRSTEGTRQRASIKGDHEGRSR